MWDESVDKAMVVQFFFLAELKFVVSGLICYGKVACKKLFNLFNPFRNITAGC